MAFEDYKTKPSIVIVYTGEGKGKTSASLGLLARALGNRSHVAYFQFIKHWGVSEHAFIRDIQSIFKDHLYFYKGGKGFYNAGDLSPTHVDDKVHKAAARSTFNRALMAAKSGSYDLVICDEINNAVHDGLIGAGDLKKLLTTRHKKTSICLTGRDFPKSLMEYVDIATNMTKLKHHFDDGFLAQKGIDY